MSMGNKSSCQWGSGCVSWTGCTLLSELSKSSHRLVRWLCVCQPTCPALPPPFPSLHPSSLPPPLCPRPHWSAVPWLLPADQSAWCLLCLGEVNKLLGQSNGKRGARRVGSWPLNARRRITEGGGNEEDMEARETRGEMKQRFRKAKRDEEEDEGSQLAYFSARSEEQHRVENEETVE